LSIAEKQNKLGGWLACLAAPLMDNENPFIGAKL
jgi:hypothetical protein